MSVRTYSLDDIVNLVFALKKIVQHQFGIGQRPAFAGKIAQVSLAHGIHDQMGEMRDAAVR